MGQSKNIFMEERESNCCGAPESINEETGASYNELGLCPACGEYCEFVSQREEERLVSNCCGHGDVEVNFLGLLCTASGEGICPKCGEHCEYINESQREEEMRVEILTGKKDTNE